MMIAIRICPLCQQKDTHEPHLSARDSLVSGETFTITRCSSCNFLITNPRPEETKTVKYYKSADYVSHTDARRDLKEVLYAGIKGVMIRRKLKWIKNHLWPQRPALLDYGCGTGDFMLFASKNGFCASGIEPNMDARNLAIKKGAGVHSSLRDLNNRTVFDVITLWHVLEHVPDVKEVLQQLYGKLNSDGLLVVAVPMASSHDAIHYKSDWAAWDLPRHLCHFTPETLHAMLAQMKLKHVATYPLPFDAWYVSLLSEQQKQIGAGHTKYNTNRIKPLRLFKAACIAIISNYRARRKKSPWSSQAFIYRKTP